MKTLNVYINDGFVPMVDGALVYHRGFGDRPTAVDDAAPSLTLPPHVFTADGRLVKSRKYPLNATSPHLGRPEPLYSDPINPGQYLVRRAYWASYFPERTIIAEAGSTISLRVHNTLADEHELSFLNTAPGDSPTAIRRHTTTGRIAPGSSKLLEFEAPPAGTYIYCDPGTSPDDALLDPVQRTLGLAGALFVANTEEPWRITPGGEEFERQWLWFCHDIEPEWARLASQGQTVDPAVTPAYPRYFTLNDRSGFESLGVSIDEALNHLREEDTLMSGAARQVDVRDFSQGVTPDTVRTGHMMRFINAGIVHHQLHFHGNHIWTVGRNGTPFPRTGGFIDAEGHVVLQQWEDVVEVHPLDRRDCVLPVKRPPEATATVWNARTGDWIYPMHCHAEPSQVAMGGMYPAGLVGHWAISAPVDIPPPPIPVEVPPDGATQGNSGTVSEGQSP
ncbi:Tat pathway signal protein [Arthrobacter sp. H14]|uniref:Tat pathway signal protein n=1 Tax=Arthrobacter sp. H14 TaxID=1312959 RepID=UPI0004BC806E|nr:Tat pathway signal protein [Arthrobacter sp. H14]